MSLRNILAVFKIFPQQIGKHKRFLNLEQDAHLRHSRPVVFVWFSKPTGEPYLGGFHETLEESPCHLKAEFDVFSNILTMYVAER